ncbi:MAG: metal-sulfur cluster assembly factor [Leptospirales bacterium]
MAEKLTKEMILAKLSKIIDPELKVNIVDLGLIYDVRIEDIAEGYKVEVDMTLTSITCPIGPTLRSAVHHRCEKFDGVSDVVVNLVFNPPWDVRKHASEDAQMDLGIV